MKLSALLAAGAVFCLSAVAGVQPEATSAAGSGGGPTELLAAQSGTELESSAARDAAQAKVRRLVRRSEKIDEIAATSCRRITRHRIRCIYHGFGKTRTRATACRLRVTVRGAGFAVSSVGLRIACNSRPILSASRTTVAMLTMLESIAGRPVPLIALERRGRGRYVGYSEWSQPVTGEEECFAELVATLSATGDFRTATQGSQCRVVGAPVSRDVYFKQLIESDPEIEPEAFWVTTGAIEGGMDISDLSWRGWGAGWASAGGRVKFRGCLSTCGKFFDLPAKVILDQVDSRCGQRRYSRIRILPRGGPDSILGPYGVDCSGSLIV